MFTATSGGCTTQGRYSGQLKQFSADIDEIVRVDIPRDRTDQGLTDLHRSAFDTFDSFPLRSRIFRSSAGRSVEEENNQKKVNLLVNLRATAS